MWRLAVHGEWVMKGRWLKCEITVYRGDGMLTGKTDTFPLSSLFGRFFQCINNNSVIKNQ